MRRFNRIIGLMKMCSTGYWTPAGEAQKTINEQEEYRAQLSLENKALKATLHELRLERYHNEMSDISVNSLKTKPTTWKDSGVIWLLMLLIGAAAGAAFMYVAMLKSIPLIQ